MTLVLDKLRIAQIAKYLQNRKTIIVLEGYDSSGQGGVIPELSYAWDPREFEVYPIGPPRMTEAAYSFLWHFWNRLPTPYQIAVFGRSWYGRLLVEWVEHGLSDTEYEASVAEIREFERMLMENQITLVKRSLETGREIHRTRLLLRAEYPEKRWKLAEGDIESYWHREAHEQTVTDLLQRFQTPPWHRIDVNQKE